MKFIFLKSVGLAAVVFVLGSCGSAPTGSLALDSLSVAEGQVSGAKYTVPDRVYIPKRSPNAGTYSPPVTGGGFAGGFLAGAAGYLIHEEMNKSRVYSKQDIEGWQRQAKSGFPSNAGSELQSRLERKLKASSAVGPLVQDQSMNQVVATIQEYGFEDNGTKDGKIRMNPFVSGTVTVSQGKAVKKTYRIKTEAFDKRHEGYELSTYAASPPSARAHFLKALEKFAAEAAAKIESSVNSNSRTSGARL